MIKDLINRLQNCPEYSCSRCTKYKTPECAVNEAIVELRRFDQVCKILERETTNE